MKDVRHIFFDLDGTLIGSSGDVLPSVWEALDALPSSIGRSVCTGRPRAGVARDVARRLAPDGLHIFENGALVGPADGDPLVVEELPTDDLARLIEASRQIDATLEFYTEDGIFVSRLDDDCRTHAAAIGIDVVLRPLDEVVAERSVARAHWIFRSGSRTALEALELPGCEVGFASSPVLPEMYFASVTRRAVSKGSAARLVSEALGFALDCAIGVGDAPGDLPLLEVVGHPFVVANAAHELLGRFEVLDHVDDRGVVPLLEKLR